MQRRIKNRLAHFKTLRPSGCIYCLLAGSLLTTQATGLNGVESFTAKSSVIQERALTGLGKSYQETDQINDSEQASKSAENIALKKRPLWKRLFKRNQESIEHLHRISDSKHESSRRRDYHEGPDAKRSSITQRSAVGAIFVGAITCIAVALITLSGSHA